MNLSTTNRKIVIATNVKTIEVEKVDALIVDYPTQTISLWRGREFKIAYNDIVLYNGTTKPIFETIVADMRNLVGEQTSYDITSAALEASHIIRSSPGYLTHLTVYNDAASTQYYQLHNSAVVPPDGTVPVFVFAVASKATVSLPIGDGLNFSVGIVVCNSSTAATKTIGSADSFFMGSFV